MTKKVKIQVELMNGEVCTYESYRTPFLNYEGNILMVYQKEIDEYGSEKPVTIAIPFHNIKSIIY